MTVPQKQHMCVPVAFRLVGQSVCWPVSLLIWGLGLVLVYRCVGPLLCRSVGLSVWLSAGAVGQSVGQSICWGLSDSLAAAAGGWEKLLLRELLLLRRETAAERTATMAERTAAERNCVRT